MFQPVWASCLTLGVGAVSWIAVAMYGGRREAWDSELYFTALFGIALIAGAVSYFAPARFWRWAFFPFAAQAVVMVALGAAGGSGASLLPLGLIMFAIFGAVSVIPAAIGAVLGRKAAAAKVVLP
jgi:hypothetical protein